MNQKIRIIGGKFRGRKITFPVISGLRPTTNRIRETLFNWLMPVIQQSRCLDLFAGSGALGFEALSRGAGEVWFVEASLLAYKYLKQNAVKLGCSDINIMHMQAEIYLSKLTTQFDIIFLDPPFTQHHHMPIIHLLQKHNTLSQTGWLYVEAPCRLQLDPIIWKLQKNQHAGTIHSALYTYINKAIQ